MFARLITVAVTGSAALIGAQGPEFAQQYRQRLGGAMDELKTIVTRFDGDAAAVGLDRATAIQRLRANPEEIARRQAASAIANVERFMRLEGQAAAFDKAGPLGRVGVMLGDVDPMIARRAIADYQPAIPATTEGAVAAGAAGAAGFGLMKLFGLLFGRRRAPKAA